MILSDWRLSFHGVKTSRGWSKPKRVRVYRSYQRIVTRQRKLPVEPSRAHLDLHLVTGFGARIPLLLRHFALKILPDSTENYGSITRTHLSLPENTTQTSRDYWGKS